jgi:hypothetical protein
MFDPFGDAEARGYLQNFEGLSDLEVGRFQEPTATVNFRR